MEVEHVINSAIVEILRNNIFYGHIVCQLPKVYTTTTPTMAVGKKRGDLLTSLFINPDYVKKIYDENNSDAAFEHIMQVITHEILHIVFRHFFLDKPNKKKQEIACECSVNSYIDRKKLLDKGVFPQDFGLPLKLGFEEYYNRLDIPEEKNIVFVIGESKKSDKSEKKKGGGSGKGPKNDDGDNSESSGGTDSEDIVIYVQDSHDDWSELKDDPMTQIMIEDIIRKSKESAETAQQWGSLPNEIRDAVDSLLSHDDEKIAWEVALRDFIASSSDTILDYTNKRQSKRYGTRPGTKKEDRLNLAIGIDTSGSIDIRQLSMFFSELYWISKQNVNITVFECDCKIGREYDFSEWDESSCITGGGGTDLTPVIIEAEQRKFDALIYFTDGFAPKVEYDFRIPVLLVIPRTKMFHISKNELPCDCQMAFFIDEDGNVMVE